ncbi:hypothetical protein BDP81DRAFT_112016 [Colletotrichum phormii]|uniref:Uncharacterized protein n=1 Tax=Colletotrichum phormii TaxID=359342 RepID=A0AAJ0EC05_9PEZI|nr:uncharacterized protein BDP81DRAFT_112016 [Colletotrichum phormii]KAK1624167.1 hypothetical protein BDP81DRAFT_112016 [Colletotrichum phormii]
MEAASRLALMAIVTRAGSPQQQLRQHLHQQRTPKQYQQRDEKAAWKQHHHPLVTVVECDLEAGLGGREVAAAAAAAAAAAGEGKRMLGNPNHQIHRSSGWGRRGSAGSSSSRSSEGSDGGAMAAGGGLEAVAWWILMGLECCVAGGVEGWIIYMVYNGGDFEIWNWLSEFASPALMILLSVSLSAALLRGVGCLNRLGDLGFQATGLVLATFCAVVVCAGVSGVEEGEGQDGDRLEKKGVRVVVGLAVKMWFLFFIGFLCAVFQWYSEGRHTTTTTTTSTTNQQPLLQKKGKKKERGYGTTTGGLATVDETYEGIVSDL